MTKTVAAILSALAVAGCDRAPAPSAPSAQPAITAPHPGPVLRDTLPVIEPRAHVPLPRARLRPKHKTAAKPLPPSPYPCAVVQLAARAYDIKTLEALAKANGLTEQQRIAAMSCLR